MGNRLLPKSHCSYSEPNRRAACKFFSQVLHSMAGGEAHQHGCNRQLLCLNSFMQNQLQTTNMPVTGIQATISCE